MIVKVDAQDFVISVEPEAVDSAMKEIRRSEAMPEATQICRGPWHYHGSKGTVLPHSAFSQSSRNPGFLNKTCNECLEKTAKRPERNETPVRHVGNPPLPVPATDSMNGTNGGLMHKWEVTVVQTVVKTVYAKDYLDAGVEAGEGDVTNVRRLD